MAARPQFTDEQRAFVVFVLKYEKSLVTKSLSGSLMTLHLHKSSRDYEFQRRYENDSFNLNSVEYKVLTCSDKYFNV